MRKSTPPPLRTPLRPARLATSTMIQSRATRLPPTIHELKAQISHTQGELQDTRISLLAFSQRRRAVSRGTPPL